MTEPRSVEKFIEKLKKLTRYEPYIVQEGYCDSCYSESAEMKECVGAEWVQWSDILDIIDPSRLE